MVYNDPMQIGKSAEYYRKKSDDNGVTNERQAVVREFVDEINAEREGTKYAKMSARAIAIKMSHVNLFDLYAFLSDCRDYKRRKGSFSKCFFGTLKNRNG